MASVPNVIGWKLSGCGWAHAEIVSLAPRKVLDACD